MERRDQRWVLAGQKEVNVDDLGIGRLNSAPNVHRILDGYLPFHSRRESFGNTGR